MDFNHSVARCALRRSEDTHVDVLWSKLPEVGATLVCANFPRSYIDVNRSLEDIDPSMFDGSIERIVNPSKRCIEQGNGLLWRLTPRYEAIYADRLPVSALDHRIENYWKPYRDALSVAVDSAAAANGGNCWHLNLHSMPSNAFERLGLPDQPLADIVLGDLQGASCEADFRDVVAAAFRAKGYSVSVNVPYAGADLIRVTGQPLKGRHSLQVEINRALYMDEATREPSSNFCHLKADIDQIVVDIAAFVADRSAVLMG